MITPSTTHHMPSGNSFYVVKVFFYLKSDTKETWWKYISLLHVATAVRRIANHEKLPSSFSTQLNSTLSPSLNRSGSLPGIILATHPHVKCGFLSHLLSKVSEYKRMLRTDRTSFPPWMALIRKSHFSSSAKQFIIIKTKVNVTVWPTTTTQSVPRNRIPTFHESLSKFQLQQERWLTVVGFVYLLLKRTFICGRAKQAAAGEYLKIRNNDNEWWWNIYYVVRRHEYYSK